MRRDIAGRTLIAAILACLHASGVHAFPNRFSVNRTLPAAPRDGFSTFEFDLNLDGTNDLRFSRVDLWATGLPIGPTEIRVSTLHAGARVATDEPIPFRETPADAFAGGRSIGPSERWGATTPYRRSQARRTWGDRPVRLATSRTGCRGVSKLSSRFTRRS